MLTSEATVETSDPARYLAQFCKHAAAMSEHAPAMFRRHAPGALAHAGGGALLRGGVQLSVECSDTSGVVEFTPWGRCTISVDSDSRLLLRVDANDADDLRRIQGVIGGDLERWGRRENLKVAWREPDPVSAQSAMAHPTDDSVPRNEPPGTRSTDTGHRRLMLTAAGGVGIALVVLVHLTLAGAATVVPLWLGWTAAGVLAIPATMVALHALGPLTVFGVVRHVLGRGPARHRSTTIGEFATKEHGSIREAELRRATRGEGDTA
jgi:hypothetical protein